MLYYKDKPRDLHFPYPLPHCPLYQAGGTNLVSFPILPGQYDSPLPFYFTFFTLSSSFHSYLHFKLLFCQLLKITLPRNSSGEMAPSLWWLDEKTGRWTNGRNETS